MKKSEAQEIAKEKSKLVIEYIKQILGTNEKVNATMETWYMKIDDERICELAIDVHAIGNNYKKNISLEVPEVHSTVLYTQILNDIFDEFIDSDNIGVTRFLTIKSQMESFTGINVVNLNEGKIKINFNTTDLNFKKVTEEYNKKYEEYIKSQYDDYTPKLK